MKFGGSAHMGGVSFGSENYTVKASYIGKDEQVELKWQKLNKTFLDNLFFRYLKKFFGIPSNFWTNKFSGKSLIIVDIIHIIVFMFVYANILMKYSYTGFSNSHLVVGLIIVSLVLFIIGISFWNPIKEVFRFHGAEHAVANVYNIGEDIYDIEKLRHSSIFSHCCGTNFASIAFFCSVCFLVYVI